MFGQANRYVYIVDNNPIYRLEVFVNLLVLNGNVYDFKGKSDVKHKYSVILENSKTKQKIIVGDLIKDGDGMYKLKYITKTDVEKLSQYDVINITYTVNDKTTNILSGSL